MDIYLNFINQRRMFRLEVVQSGLLWERTQCGAVCDVGIVP